MNYTRPWSALPSEKIIARQDNEVTASEYRVTLNPKMSALMVLIIQTAFLPDADDAIEDALNEIKEIHTYYKEKALLAVKHKAIPSAKREISLINQMHIISKQKAIPYDTAE